MFITEVERTMRKAIIIALTLLLVLPLLSTGCAEGTKGPSVDLEKVSEFEGGFLYKSDGIYVCQLNGSYEEMGRQYGGLMKTQIRQFHDEAMKAIVSNAKPTDEALNGIPEKQYEKYPARIKGIFTGMEETSGLSLAELKFCDSVETVAMAGELSRANCSAVVAWGPYTGGGPLVFGRNFDYPDYFKEFNDTLTVVVYNPNDGSRSTATLVNAGQVCTLNSFNDKGLMLEVNDGMGSGDLRSVENRASNLIEALTFLLDASDFVYLDSELESTLPYHAFIITASDSRRGVHLRDEHVRGQAARRPGRAAGGDEPLREYRLEHPVGTAACLVPALRG